MKSSQHVGWFVMIVIGMVVCVACGATDIPSDSRIATRVAEDLAIASTLTSVAATAQAANKEAATPGATSVAIAPTVESATAQSIPRPTLEDVRPATQEPQPALPTSTPTPVPVDEPENERVAYQDSKPEGNITPGSAIDDGNGNLVDGVTITGGISIADVRGQQNDLLIAQNQLAIRVDAQLAGGQYDAATNNGIRQVAISIVRLNADGSQGPEVHSKTEKNWPYCSFSDDGSSCTIWVFADHDNQWPNGEPFEDGQYQVNVLISLNDYEQTQPFWFTPFSIQRS